MIEIKFTINAKDRIKIEHDVKSTKPTKLEKLLLTMLSSKVAKLFSDLAHTFNNQTFGEEHESK